MWDLQGYDKSENGNDAYKSLTMFTFQSTGTAGNYIVVISQTGNYTDALVIPSQVNGNTVTAIVQNSSLTNEQKVK